MSEGFGVYHEMDYDSRSLERGEYVELEIGAQKNDKSLLGIGYLKPHDGQNLEPCLRCGKKFVTEMFLRHHEETCPIETVTVPSDAEVESVGEESETPSIAERAVVAQGVQGE